MKTKRVLGTFFAVVLSLSTAVNCLASGVSYLPNVTSEMSSPSFWTEETDILMALEEIEKLNEETMSEKGTNMYDLKNQP